MNYILLTITLLCGSAVAQVNPGPRAMAMGGGRAAQSGVWSGQANPAGLSQLKRVAVALAYEQHILDQSIITKMAVFAVPVNKYVIAASAEAYGIASYKEQSAALSCGREFGDELRIGLTARYHQLLVPDYGSTDALSIAAGLQYNISQTLGLSAFISTAGQGMYTDVNLAIPLRIATGVTLKVDNKIDVVADLEKTTGMKADARLGLEYRLARIFSLRAGISAEPFRQYGGFGLSYKSIGIDASVASQQLLGYSPQLGLNYAF